MKNIPESTQKHIDDLVKTINKLNKERNKLNLENKELKKQLTIPNVSQQRELLLDYHRYLTEELSLDLHELWVDEHLKTNNCG